MADTLMPKFLIFGRKDCVWCAKACDLLTSHNRHYEFVDIRMNDTNMGRFRHWFPEAQTVPQIVYYSDVSGGVPIGGYTQLKEWWSGFESIEASPV